MKKLLFALLVLFVFSISVHAQMGGAMSGGPMGEMGGPSMMGKGQGMMDSPKMQGQGMMQGCQVMGQGMMGGMMGMGRERMGRHNPWFRYGVTRMLQNADKLGLSDEQKKQLDEMRIKYSKDIIRLYAETEIAEIDLEPLLKNPEINLSQVKETLKKIESMKTQIKYLRVEAFVEARKVLTNEQKNSLRKIMEMRGIPRCGGMMISPEEEKEETPEEEIPEADIHGH